MLPCPFLSEDYCLKVDVASMDSDYYTVFLVLGFADPYHIEALTEYSKPRMTSAA